LGVVLERALFCGILRSKASTVLHNPLVFLVPTRKSFRIYVTWSAVALVLSFGGTFVPCGWWCRWVGGFAGGHLPRRVVLKSMLRSAHMAH